MVAYCGGGADSQVFGARDQIPLRAEIDKCLEAISNASMRGPLDP
jgi:hypothetical protein